ncbi:MAG: PAS domain S-box protein [Elainellaceae cyanobacterium]
MSTASQRAIQSLSLEHILSRPLIVASDAIAATVVEQMGQIVGRDCALISPQPALKQQEPGHGQSRAEDSSESCALVVGGGQLLGIFTERNVVKLLSEDVDLEQVVISEVMTQPVITLRRADADNIFTVLTTLKQHRIRQLPILDRDGSLMGIVSQTSIRRAMQPYNFLKFRLVGDAMTRDVVQAEASDSLMQLTQLMIKAQVSCVVITEPGPQDGDRVPIGIVTERDVLRFRALKLSLSRTCAEAMMSAPLLLLHSQDTLWQAHQQMQQCHARRLVVIDDNGNLAGIVTQTSLIQVLNPLKILEDVEQLQQLSEEQTVELKQANHALQAEIAERQRLEAALRDANQSLEGRVGLQAARLVQTDEALQQEIRERLQAQAHLEKFFDVAPSLLCIAGLDGYFKRLNSSFGKILGYTNDELLAEPFLNFIHPEDQAATQAELERLAAGELSIAFENRCRIKQGSYRWLAWNAIASPEDGLIYAAAHDVTDRKHDEQALARQYHQGQILSEIIRKISELLDPKDILQTTVAEVRNLLDCSHVLIIECDDAGVGTVVQEAIADDSTILSFVGQTDLDLKFASQTQAHHLPEACIRDDVESAPCSLYSSNFLEQQRIWSCVEMPIFVDGHFWGLIVANQCHHARQWQAYEVELMQRLAKHIGVAIFQTQLLSNLNTQVKRRTEQLIEANAQLEAEIEERRQAEIALRDNQQKLAGILKNAGDAIISIDSQQRIIMYNQGAEGIFGYTFEEAYGQPLDILLPKAFQQIHRQHVRSFAASPNIARQMANRNREVFGQRKSGEEFPAEASLAKLETQSGFIFTVILKDITERRQFETALLRSEERLRLTTNAIPALICYVNTEQRYSFNNQTYQDWFNISPEALQGRHIRDVLGEVYYATIEPHIETALLGRQAKFESELTPPDGRTRYLSTTYIPEVDGQGNVKGFFALVNDISDRKATERMKDELVSVVGHELRTPLTSIHGALELLASNGLGPLTPQAHKFTTIALKNTQRLIRLINDVLDLERLELGQQAMTMASCSIGELMLQAAEGMQPLANDKTLQIHVEPLHIRLWLNSDAIIQVLANLLSNAIKFSPTGAAIKLSASECKDGTIVQVKDDGRGIPADKLTSIFERFRQVDASDSRQLGGTGLGLAICKTIVHRHGGKIWVESTVGEGSTFYFTLPNSC